jgi:hypothetical protein
MALIATINRATITERGINFPPDMTVEEWRETLAMLKAVKNGYHMALADTVSYGRENFGNEVVAEAMVQLEFSQADFNHASDITRIPVGLRANNEGLTSEHFHVVGATFGDDEVRQKQWLELATKEDLSPRELRRSIEIGAVTKDDAKRTGRESGGFVTIQSIMATFTRWEKQVGGPAALIKTCTETERREWLKMTKPFADLRAAVEDSLPPTSNPEL